MSQTQTSLTEYVKPFAKIMDKICYQHSYDNVFSDLLDISICCAGLGAYEEKYLEIIKRYKKDEVKLLIELFAQMIMLSDNDGAGFRDVLGDFYMDYLSHGRNGEYFTPDPICQMMAKMTAGDVMFGRNILDPACGSGRMLMATAKASGVHNFFYGIDVNSYSTRMCAINLWMHCLPGYAIHGNALSLECWGGYHISISFKEKQPCPQIIIMSKEEVAKMMPEFGPKPNIPKKYPGKRVKLPSENGAKKFIKVEQPSLFD